MSRRRGRVLLGMVRIAEVGVWWVVLTGVWAVTVSPMTVPDMVVGAACAVPCALVAVPARRALRSRWRVDPAALRWLPAVALGAVTDTVRVLLGRPAPPRVREVVLAEVGGGRDPAAQDTYRALATIAIAATPGSVVLGERGRRGLVLHELGRSRPEVSEVVRS
ncbi:Na+/H+ antiporter subunit E [Pseudonocardia sp. RS11V-5]|uniref:Na+/H+ antiporter subunit E n=1 Tax=Pseudonocardia terrae TaxID=2905831 RepID=UPI001E5F52C4|nr:Na+/H+ antiporter subunit E [Pseudonocardia terrae]MCE3553275.1 Na+/H+ antiporter subunit E [Pseudonocardia terrae]